jgi:predicted regulator of Ras-like GTPase activity (Roadblock/LC7/MglB family)
MMMIKHVLKEFLQIDGVITAALIGRDGFVIEYVENNPSDIEALGALGSEAMRSFSKGGASMKMGSVQQVVLEHQTGAIIVTKVTEDEYLAVLADTTSTLGRLAYILPKITTRVAAVM